MYPGDLESLEKYLGRSYEPLPYGRVGITATLIENILSILPPGTPIGVAISAAKHVGRLPPYLRYISLPELEKVCEFIDTEWTHMSNMDKSLLLYAPLPWRDSTTITIIKKMLTMHGRVFEVDFNTVIQGSGFMETLEYVEDMKDKVEKRVATFSTNSSTLKLLESFHNTLVFYIWMNFRTPIVYSDLSVINLKERVETLLNWSLANMSIIEQKRAKEEYLERLRDTKSITPPIGSGPRPGKFPTKNKFPKTRQNEERLTPAPAGLPKAGAAIPASL